MEKPLPKKGDREITEACAWCGRIYITTQARDGRVRRWQHIKPKKEVKRESERTFQRTAERL